jgi:Ca2+-dependent lipid-binding protein
MKGMKEMEVCVVAAAGLAKANAFGTGLSDPFCIIRWNGVEIGRSSVKQDTLDPVWEQDEFFTIRAVDAFPYGISVDEIAEKGKSQAVGFKKLKEEASKQFLESQKSIKADANTQMEVMSRYELTVDVFDWNRFGPGVYLGGLELRGRDLIEFASSGSEHLHKKQWFDLSTTSRLKQKEQKLVQGKIQLMIGPKPNAGAAIGKEIELVVRAARGLAKADTFGQADPYVRIRWNHKYVNKSRVIKNTLSPVWGDEKFMLHLPTKVDLKDCNLYLEVWDWDLVGYGNFLGSNTQSPIIGYNL